MEENLVQQEEDQVPLDLKKKDRSIWIVSAIILTLLIPMITFLARPYLVGSKPIP